MAYKNEISKPEILMVFIVSSLLFLSLISNQEKVIKDLKKENEFLKRENGLLKYNLNDNEILEGKSYLVDSESQTIREISESSKFSGK